ncbi:DUF1631 family protein [Dyella subtropica]|uniref:DUF1631 family protein n=1 Tax=Dyella subtropica TaxID=2992127 RepID=UPI0022574012|nr:DUF1631 family protein [Dyella subtropica]
MDVEHQDSRQPLASSRGDRLDNPRWSPRARRLIEEVHTFCLDWLAPPLRRGLADLERRFYAHAMQSRDPLEQQRFLVIRGRLQSEQELFERRFMADLRDRFRRMGEDPVEPVAAEPVSLTLELLDETAHEQGAALEKIIARGEARNSLALHELGYRMAVLVGVPPLEGEDLPLGPQALACAFREAGDALQIPGDHGLLMLESFEHAVIQELNPLYETINELLRGDGILPRLRAFPVTQLSIDRGNATAPDVTTAAAEPTTGAAHGDNIAVLETLRNLLAQRRTGLGGWSLVDGGRTASLDELQEALNALQLHLTSLAGRAGNEQRSAHRLHNELLMQLNAGHIDPETHTHLSKEHSDMVELVGLLFEQIRQQLHGSASAHTLLSGLELPLLRLVVADHSFFDQREHPARQLLSTVGDVVNEWLSGPEGEEDRVLAGKLAQWIAHARLQQPSEALYANLLSDVEGRIEQLNCKAQAAERLHVEAMQGRERLEQARQRAAGLMAERFKQTPPRGLLRTLLERAWSDVLALTLLRHGEENEVFTARLQITDQLLGTIPVHDRLQLQLDIENGLQQIGMHGDEAAQVALRLLTLPQDEQETGEEPDTDKLALKLEQHQRLGERQACESTMPQAPQLEDHEQRIHDRLCQLPPGAWFEFADPDSSKTTRLKLAWFSPVSDNALFVTRRGTRAGEKTLRQLAREIASNQARAVPPERETLLDRAWAALTSNLRRAAHLQSDNLHPGADGS